MHTKGLFGRGSRDLSWINSIADLRSIVDLPGNCLANAAALDPCKGVFVGMARIVLGLECSLYITASRQLFFPPLPTIEEHIACTRIGLTGARGHSGQGRPRRRSWARAASLSATTAGRRGVRRCGPWRPGVASPELVGGRRKMSGRRTEKLEPTGMLCNRRQWLPNSTNLKLVEHP